MQKDEAIMILSRHLMQCGMLMPIEWVQSNGEGSEFMQAFEMAMDALKNEPVRCKECKHWMKDVAGCTEFVGRYEWANYMVGAAGYCVYGERKEA